MVQDQDRVALEGLVPPGGQEDASKETQDPPNEQQVALEQVTDGAQNSTKAPCSSRPKCWSVREMMDFMKSRSERLPEKRTRSQSKAKLSRTTAPDAKQPAIENYFNLRVASRGQMGSIGVQLEPDPQKQTEIVEQGGPKPVVDLKGQEADHSSEEDPWNQDKGHKT